MEISKENLEAFAAAFRGCAAKTGTDEKGGKMYLPLWMHLLDTAGMMEKLYDQRVSIQEKQLFCRDGLDEEVIRKTFVLAALLHDIGKASAAFQTRMKTVLKDLPDFSLPLPDAEVRDGKSHHSYLGMLILMELGFSQAFASVCGAHHGKTQPQFPLSAKRCRERVRSRIQLESAVSLSSGKPGALKQWKECWKDLVEAALEIAGFESVSDIPDLSPALLLVLAGYVSDADWMASSDSFQLISLAPVNWNEQAAQYPKRTEAAWGNFQLQKTISHIETSDPASRFQDLFAFDQKTPVQETVIEVLKDIREPGLMIIESEMGSGKTEASLLAADCFASRQGSGGAFYGLPTMATANGLLARFHSWAQKEAGANSAAFRLLHSKASSNEMYQRLPKTPPQTEEDASRKGTLFLNEWFHRSRLGLFSDYVIGTIDQALMAALDSRYVSLRHAGLAGKTVVLDEIHSYDTYTGTFLECFLSWMGRYGVPVVLLSATLTAQKRQSFLQAYLDGKSEDAPLVDVDTISHYPGIVWTDGLEVHGRAIEQSAQRQIKIEKTEVEDEAAEVQRIEQLLKDKLRDGGVAGVIVNTVSCAQELFQDLESSDLGCRIVLLHSRFKSSDRQEKEELIQFLVGKESSAADRDRLVVIGTQVLEQSLDLDFDCLLTELAPIDLLIQRIGRLHRHQRPNRPERLKTPVCTVIERSAGKLDPSVHSFYEDWYLLKTQAVLPDSVSIPADISSLVESVYRVEEGEREAFETAKKQAEIAYAKNRSAAEVHLLSLPIEGDEGFGLNGLMNKPDIQNDQNMMLSVRQGSQTMECILMDSLQDLKNAGPADVDRNAVRFFWTEQEVLAAEMAAALEPVFPENERPQWLKHRNIVILDENGRADFPSARLIYSKSFGLKVQKPEESAG